MNKSDIIFPPFVALFINDAGKTCIYYYRGLTKDNKFAYQAFKEEELPAYEKMTNKDGSIIYEFANKITKIQCNLVSDIYPSKKILISL